MRKRNLQNLSFTISKLLKLTAYRALDYSQALQKGYLELASEFVTIWVVHIWAVSLPPFVHVGLPLVLRKFALLLATTPAVW